jgi:hypothetical protein
MVSVVSSSPAIGPEQASATVTVRMRMAKSEKFLLINKNGERGTSI